MRVNYKGGVGKTTVTYLVGLYIALITARKVLLLDIDAQCSLSLAVGFDPEQVTKSSQNVYHLVKPDAWADISHKKLGTYIQSIPGLVAPLYIIPGGFQVEDLDIEITEALSSKRERSKHEFFLYCRQLIGAFDDYEYVLIDCPPNKMYLTQAMLRASRFFIPVTIPDRISIDGMPRLLRWISAIEGDERPIMLGFVLNLINRTGGSVGGKVKSQQFGHAELKANVSRLLSRFEMLVMDQEPCLGQIPRLDQVAKFLGADKSLRLDFAHRTSGQPSVDECLKDLTANVLQRIQKVNA